MHSLSEENMRVTQLGNGTFSSMSRYTADNGSVSDIDEHDRARTYFQDDISEVSSLDDDEKVAGGQSSGGRNNTLMGKGYS